MRHADHLNGAIRALVSAIELTPEDGKLAIVLRGDLAAMLSFAAHKAKPGAPSLEAGLLRSVVSQESLGAGTGFERYLTPALIFDA